MRSFYCRHIASIYTSSFSIHYLGKIWKIFSKSRRLFNRVVIAKLWGMRNFFFLFLLLICLFSNVITDMGTVTRLFGRLVSHMVMDFDNTFQAATLLYTKMLEMLHYTNVTMIQYNNSVSNLMPLPVVPDL